MKYPYVAVDPFQNRPTYKYASFKRKEFLNSFLASRKKFFNSSSESVVHEYFGSNDFVEFDNKFLSGKQVNTECILTNLSQKFVLGTFSEAELNASKKLQLKFECFGRLKSSYDKSFISNSDGLLTSFEGYAHLSFIFQFLFKNYESFSFLSSAIKVNDLLLSIQLSQRLNQRDYAVLTYLITEETNILKFVQRKIT